MSQFTHKYDRTVFGGAEILSVIGSASGNAWWGRTMLSSDTNGVSVTISTQIVASGSIITYGTANNGMVNSVTVPRIDVSCITQGVSFRFVTAGSWAAVGSITVMWTLFNPTP